MSGGFTALALLSVAARLMVYLACIAALPVIRDQRGLPRSFTGAFVIIAALAVTVFLIGQSEWKSWAGLAVAIALGFTIRLFAQPGINRVGRDAV